MATDIEEGLVSLLGADPSVVAGMGSASPSPTPAVSTSATATTPSPSAPTGFPYATERKALLGMGGGPSSFHNIVMRFIESQKGREVFNPIYDSMRKRGVLKKQKGGALDIEEGLVNLLGADPSLVMGRGIGRTSPSPSPATATPPSTVMLGAPAPTAAPTSPSAFAAAPDGFPYAAERDWWLSGGPESMGKALLLAADRQRGPGIFNPWYAEIRRRGLMNKQAGGALVPGQNSVVPQVLNPIISAPIPPPNYGIRVVPPSSEAQQRSDYDYTLNTLKSSPIYPGANFANVGPQGYNVGENNIQADQGLSPFIQQNQSALRGQTTGGLSQVLPNPGNTQGGLSTLNNTRGAFS